MILGVVIYRMWKADHRSAVRQPSDRIPAVKQVNQGSVIFSPQKDRGVAVIDETGRSQIWVISVVDNRRSLAMQLEKGEAARNIRWSPDGHFFAFEAHDPDGHSPMTTTHVWVVKADGTDAERSSPASAKRALVDLPGWMDRRRQPCESAARCWNIQKMFSSFIAVRQVDSRVQSRSRLS